MMLPLQGPGGNHEITERRIDAAADDHLIHLESRHLTHRNYRVGRVGPGDQWFEFVQNNGDFFVVRGAGIRRRGLPLRFVRSEVNLPRRVQRKPAENDAAAVLTAVELAVSGTSALDVALPAMVGTHILFGVGEGLITVAAIALVESARPDLVESEAAA